MLFYFYIQIDNRQLCSPTDQQGDSPHCVAYSACSMIESKYWKQNGIPIQLDAHLVYAKAKEIDSMQEINGTYPEAAIKAAIELGGLPKSSKVKTYYNTKDERYIKTMKHLIHKYDFVLGGFMIDEEWYKIEKGKWEILKQSKNTLGGHCVLIVGYDTKGVYIQNSWGIDWGAKGFARISWDIFLKEFMYGSVVS